MQRGSRLSPRRPFGATLISLLLGWLAVAAFLNAFAWKAAALTFNEALPPRLSILIGTAQSWRFTVLALAYGITALIASIGTWRLRPWMAQAFLSWSLAATTLMTWLVLVFRQELPAHSQTVAWLGVLCAVVLFTVIYFYLRGIAKGARRAARR